MFSTTWGVVEGTNRKPVIATGVTATPEQAEAIFKWINLNERAWGLIFMYIEPKFHHQIIDLPSTKKMWDQLVEEYDSPSTMGAFIMWQRLFCQKYNENQPLLLQIQSTLEDVGWVTTAGITIEDHLQMLIIIFALPDSYDVTASNIINGIFDLSVAKPSMVIPKIRKEEQRRTKHKKVNKISHTPNLQKKCDKCGIKNHTTEQH